eukprot:gene10133-2552_t
MLRSFLKKISSTVYKIIEYIVIYILKFGPIPKHVAFIMDGNRRWAKNNNLTTEKGHENGYEKLKDTLDWCQKFDIEEVTVFAFSIENFKRSESEVNTLMNLAQTKFEEMMSQDIIDKYDLKIKILGEKSLLPKGLQDTIDKVESYSSDRKSLLLNICFSYTSNQEITSALKKCNKFTIEELNSNLYTSHEPDILIRTSGERRLSDFLTWQCGNSLIYFLSKSI